MEVFVEYDGTIWVENVQHIEDIFSLPNIPKDVKDRFSVTAIEDEDFDSNTGLWGFSGVQCILRPSLNPTGWDTIETDIETIFNKPHCWSSYLPD